MTKKDARARDPLAFDPDWCIHPGDTLAEWCADNGFTPRTRGAAAMACGGMPPEMFEGIIAGDVAITEPIARGLAWGTGIPARLWLSLEHHFRKELAEGKTWTRP